MLNANELRIGNWVKANKKNYTDEAGFVIVKSICDEHINKWKDYDNGVPIGGCLMLTEVEPIPLTLEILQKAGFVKSREFEDEFPGAIIYEKVEMAYYFHKYRPPHEHSRNGGWWLVNEDLSPINNEPIKYVHQLQNLYFALTGEELVKTVSI